MDALASASGVSRASLYRLFGSRKGLIDRLSAENGLQIQLSDQDPDIPTRILKAAETVLSETGSLNFTMEQVADEAGLGVATLYRHFGSKDRLLEQMAERINPRQAASELAIHASGDVEADLIQFATRVLVFMQDQGALARMFFSGDARLNRLFHSNRNSQERTLTNLTRYLAGQIQDGNLRGGDPFNLATAFFGMILGFAFLKPSYTHTREDPQAVARTIVHIWLDGVKAGK